MSHSASPLISFFFRWQETWLCKYDCARPLCFCWAFKLWAPTRGHNKSHIYNLQSETKYSNGAKCFPDPWCALCTVSSEATARGRQTYCHVRHCPLSAHSPWTVCGLARLWNRFRLDKVEHSAIHFLNQYCSLVYAGRMESLPHLRIPSCKSHGPHTEAAQTVKIKPIFRTSSGGGSPSHSFGFTFGE